MQVNDTLYISTDGVVLNVSVEAWPTHEDSEVADIHDGANADLSEVGEVVEAFREHALDFKEGEK